MKNTHVLITHCLVLLHFNNKREYIATYIEQYFNIDYPDDIINSYDRTERTIS
jgi:hypothetical protein